MSTRKWLNRRFSWERRPISLVMVVSAVADEQGSQAKDIGKSHPLLGN